MLAARLAATPLVFKYELSQMPRIGLQSQELLIQANVLLSVVAILLIDPTQISIRTRGFSPKLKM